MKNTYCAVKTCFNSTKNCKKSFFRFPADVKRSREWAVACNRPDLTEGSNYNSFRVCADHFEDYMYRSEFKNRLIPLAVPTILCGETKVASINRLKVNNDDELILRKLLQDDGKQSQRIYLADENCHKICRACLQQISKVDVFEICYQNIKLHEIFEKYVVKIEKDGILTTGLCLDCKQELLQAHEFINKCLKSEQTLQDYKIDKLRRTYENVQMVFIVDDYKEKEESKSDMCLDTIKMDNLNENNENLQFPLLVEEEEEGQGTIKLQEQLLINKLHSYAKVAKTDELKPNMCKSDFPPSSNKKVESKRKLRPTRQIQCQHCPMIFKNKSDYMKHCRLTEHYHIYKCPTCSKSFKKRSSLVIHMETHSKDIATVCDQCGLSFRSLSKFRKHKQSKHEVKILKHKCTYCERLFSMNSILVKHIRTHTKEKPYCCEHCGAVFATSGNLCMHQKRHFGIKPFICEVCGKGFTRKNQLFNHMPKHSDERNYSCNICGIKFKRKLNLDRHNKKSHGNSGTAQAKEIIQCKECDVVCGNKLDYKLHMRRTHKLYTCMTCCKSFRYYSSFHKHKTGHNYAVKKYECPHCDKKFISPGHLKVHMPVHTGEKNFSCVVCSKKFSLRHHLKSHILIHTGDRPFKCTFCEKAFAHQTTLVVHERSHTGETPHVCQICGKGFGHITNYKKHMFALHGVKIESKKPVYKKTSPDEFEVGSVDDQLLLDDQPRIEREEFEVQAHEEVPSGHEVPEIDGINMLLKIYLD